MVNYEIDDGQIYDVWESVGFGVVQIFLEVYECLKVEGFLVEYVRVFIIDGKVFKSFDFGVFVFCIVIVFRDIVFVFNCQVSCMSI